MWECRTCIASADRPEMENKKQKNEGLVPHLSIFRVLGDQGLYVVSSTGSGVPLKMNKWEKVAEAYSRRRLCVSSDVACYIRHCEVCERVVAALGRISCGAVGGGGFAQGPIVIPIATRAACCRRGRAVATDGARFRQHSIVVMGIVRWDESETEANLSNKTFQSKCYREFESDIPEARVFFDYDVASLPSGTKVLCLQLGTGLSQGGGHQRLTPD